MRLIFIAKKHKVQVAYAISLQSQGTLKKIDGDDNSDLSAEVTTSDSGRGGSEDDLNTSTVLSYSMDFGK